MSTSNPERVSEKIIIRDNLQELYGDIYTPDVVRALEFMAAFNKDVKQVMKERIQRRMYRIQNKKHIEFLNHRSKIPLYY